MPASSRPLARLSGPGEIAATVPLLCGFRPQDSVVVLSLRGRRRRLGLTIRLDLPPREHAAEAARLLAARVAGDGGTAAAVVVLSESGRQDRLVEEVVDACAGLGIAVVEAVHVTGGRWTSYLCSGSCCPAEGTPLPPAPSLVAAEHALEGRDVLPSREDLVRALAAPAAPVAPVEGAIEEWTRRALVQGAVAARTAAVEQVRTVLRRVAEGAQVGASDAARVAAALQDVVVRDEVATWSLDDAAALQSLAEAVVRQVGPPHDAPACTLLAWVSYSRGDGARANVALDRALATDPGYGLALLLRQALDGGIPAEQVRDLLRDTARALRPTSTSSAAGRPAAGR
jgi:hypothetical protein